jgi:hypothetical protein
MSTAYSTADVVSTPLVLLLLLLLDRELKKVTIGLAIRGEILVGRACGRTSIHVFENKLETISV